MKNKTISISDEMYQELKGYSNASGLIDCLLREYFLKNKGTAKEEKLKIIDKIKEEADTKIELVKKEVEKIEATEEQKQADADKIEARKQHRIVDFINLIHEYGFEITTEQAETYFELFDNKMISYYQFLDNLKKEHDTITKQTE